MLFAKKTRFINRLLIVEDEPLVAFDTEHYLRDDGYQVVDTLDRADEAIRLIEGGASIDLVLADVDLADGSGVDVARAARQAGIAVLFVTGNVPPDAHEYAVGCLAKPYAPRNLLAAIALIDGLMTGETPRRPPSGLTLFQSDR